MKRPRRQFLRLSAGAAALTVISVFVLAVSNPGAWSQTTRTIKVVVPFPPGGAADTLARLLAEEIGRAGPTVVIENRPGGGAAIAYEAVARAAPDGNTLVINGNSLVINPHFRKVNYDPLTSFEPVCHLVNSPNLIVVNSSSPYRTLDDYLAAARSKPGELAFCGSRSRDRTTYRVRTIRAPRWHQCNFCTLSRWRTCGYSGARRTCECGAGQLFGSY